MANSTLAAIRTKVRRLTQSLSTAQLTDADIDEYVNTFIQYDLPSHLRLFSLRRTLTWYTQPNIDTYDRDSTAAGLDDFDQENITIHPPVYVAGFQVYFTQSRDDFFTSYPFNNSINMVTTGDGVTTNFNGTLSSVPILRNHVTFVSIDGAGNGLRLSDTSGIGVLVGDGVGTIDYVTGAFTLNFNVAPAANEAIESETVPYVAARPQSVLYYNNTFTLRPVPDRVYPVTIDVYVRPTELIVGGDIPELEQWWQYIAYGAAKKVFEDRLDMDSLQLILPEFKQQERLVLRKTIVQQTNERVATIYTQQYDNDYGPGFFPGGGNF